MTYDILIKNGMVLDGVANEPYPADIGISGNTIKAIGNLSAAKGAAELSAKDCFVCPGFVDIQNHSDSYLTILDNPGMAGLVSQGITTIYLGHCGTSLAPLTSPEAIKSIQKWRALAGANINWQTYAEYLEALSRYPLGVNVAGLVGHATVRRGMVGDQPRADTEQEIKIVEQVIRRSLDEGAKGVSLGLVYAHEVDSSEKELLSVAKVAASREKILSAHLRSEGSHVVAALSEVIDLAEKSGAALKISHFKIRGEKNYHFLDEALSVLDRAYQRGVKVNFDVYPYTTSWTVLYTYLPKWAYEGGRTAILRHLKDRMARERILAYLKGTETNLGSVFVASAETNPGFAGKTLSQIAINQETSVEEAFLRVIEATSAQAIAFDRNLSEEVMFTLLKHPLGVVATDGAGYGFAFSAAQGLVHPRCFGAMPKFLSLVREKKLMTWTDAIKKITSRPADIMRLGNRGRIAAGATADIVVFDPKTVGSRATYENPYVAADGINFVVVNGQVAFSSREHATAAAGRVLK